MPKLYVTYGNGTRLYNAFSCVEAATIEECYNEVALVTQGKYAFTYEEKDFQGQVEKYGLREVPLQPMSAYE